jgi:hypothetical protein
MHHIHLRASTSAAGEHFSHDMRIVNVLLEREDSQDLKRDQATSAAGKFE